MEKIWNELEKVKDQIENETGRGMNNPSVLFLVLSTIQDLDRRLRPFEGKLPPDQSLKKNDL